MSHSQFCTPKHSYLLPDMAAMNFVIEDALEGGVNTALCLDSHGKTLSFLLLALQIMVPSEHPITAA